MSGLDDGDEGGATETVAILAHVSVEGGRHNSLEDDFLVSEAEATCAGDTDGQLAIARLLGYFAGLRSLGADELIKHLESKKVWRRFGEWPVYKTSGTPCAAFTASVIEQGHHVDLVVLGMCYRYPLDGDEGWWQNVILPRLRSL